MVGPFGIPITRFVSNSFHSYGFRFSGTINETNDYFEPRVWGQKFIRPVWTNMRAWVSSNYQKRIAVDASLGYVDVQRNDWWEWNYELEFRFRITNQLFLIHEWEQKLQYNSEGYAVKFGDPINLPDVILFGDSKSLGIDYTLTNRLELHFD